MSQEEKEIESLAEVLEKGLEEEPAEEAVEVAEEVAEAEKEAAAETSDETSEESTESEKEDKAQVAENVEGEAAEPAETSEETAEGEDKPKKSKKGWIIAGISVAVILIGLLGAYLGIAQSYKNKFFTQTVINDVDCSKMTIKDVEKVLQKQIEEYVLTIHEFGGEEEQIVGSDIGMQYINHEKIKEALKNQNPYEWPKGFFEVKKIKAEIIFEYDTEKLNASIAALKCMQAESQQTPTDATIVYKDGKFEIQDEVPGTQLDTEKAKSAIVTAVDEITTEISLEEKECYIQPRFKKDSEEVISAQKQMNSYLEAGVTYSYEGIEQSIGRDTFVSWIGVDADMNPTVSLQSAVAYAATLASAYNTPDKAAVLTTPTGKEVTIGNAAKGRAISSQKEGEQLVQDIKSGKKVNRAPVFDHMETPAGQLAWGNTYAEVDISAQHMWYIVNGEIALETDVVTGKRGSNDTPTGVFSICEKARNRVLTGRIVNGKPLYRTPVSYWMRITWSGIGFHDANWQPTFGGERYVTNGSHGCVNMPPAMAKRLYEIMPMGTPVIIHH